MTLIDSMTIEKINRENIIDDPYVEKRISNLNDIDSENYDPFLCPECRKYGYCIKLKNVSSS